MSLFCISNLFQLIQFFVLLVTYSQLERLFGNPNNFTRVNRFHFILIFIFFISSIFLVMKRFIKIGFIGLCINFNFLRIYVHTFWYDGARCTYHFENRLCFDLAWCKILGSSYILFFSDLFAFVSWLNTQKQKHHCQHDLNDNWWTHNQNKSTNLRSCKRRRHHNASQAVVNHDHVWLFRMSMSERKQKTADCRCESRKWGHCNSWLSRKAKEVNHHGNNNATATDSSNCRRCFDKQKGKYTPYLNRQNWENKLVYTNFFFANVKRWCTVRTHFTDFNRLFRSIYW